jgi:serine/threonine protein kinase/tetratricopeptide (TPR) repeat protein
MLLDVCPLLDDLRLFLDEQLELSRQAEIGTHVDACESCQAALDGLTRAEAAGLLGSTLDLSPCFQGRGAEARASTHRPDGDNNGTQERPHPGTEARVADRLDGESTVDDARSTTDLPPGETHAHDGSTDPQEPVGPVPAVRGLGGEAGSDLLRIASYDLLDVLGAGGMGVVYRAKQRGLNRLVAVKMIRGAGRGSPNHLARIRIEAEAVARLRHPNIIQIFEIGEADGGPFVSLELLEGGSLDDRLAGTPQRGADAAELMITLARAVQVAHDAGIVHRDLKPSNVLFTDDGTPKITDFGLAKRLESDSRQTESGQIMGSPSYMAPEQARGHSREVGPAADVYALGAVLYEMLTGRPPFKGETPIETVRQVVEDEVVPPSRLVPRVARDLETICLQCLHKEPARRYGSARALAEDLTNYLAGRPVAARRTPLWECGVKLARRHPLAATLFTIGLVATSGLTAAWLESSSRATRRKAELRTKIWGSLFKTQDLVRQERWGEAEPDLTAIQAEIRGERDLDDLAHRTGDLLRQVRLGRDAQATKSKDQERLRSFRERRRDALFHEILSSYTDLGLSNDREAVRNAARAALAVFAPGGVESWELGPLPPSFSPREHDEIKEGCFELLLVLADAEGSADLGLRLVDRAERLRPSTRASHLRRAACLARRGDAVGAESERKRAETVPLVSATDHFLIGHELYKRGDWAAARPHFDAALLSEPGHFWAHCLSAISSIQLEQPIQAKAELNACLQAEAGLAWLYNLRGFASYKIARLARMAAGSLPVRGRTLRTEVQRQLQDAEADYDRALKLLGAAPSKDLRYPLLLNRGLLWLERRRWDKAEADLRAAIQLDERRWLAFENLGHVYLQQDLSDQAVEQFTRAITLRPDWAPLYRARAVANMDRKASTPAQRALAAADLEQAIKLEPPGSPDLAPDHTRRARLLHREGREDQALAACEAALKIDPDYLDALRLRVELHRSLKHDHDVIRSCNDLLVRDRPSATLYELRGLARENLRDFQGAIEDLTLAIALHPGHAPSLARRGALYLVTDALRSALRDFQEAIRLDASNADAYLGRGLALAALGQHREAVADAVKAMGLGEPTATRLYNAARIHALAAIAQAAEARKTGSDAVRLATRNQDHAVRLLAEWLKRLPAADRDSALRDLLHDPAMATLRHRLRSLGPAGTISPSAASTSQPRP